MKSITLSFVIRAAIVGMIAGAVMAMYAMLASATVLNQGFFTPLYGIASPFTGSSAMITSMHSGVYWSTGPAIVGLIVHMMVSAMLGIVFGSLVQLTALRGGMAILAGMIFGIVVQAMMTLVILPIIGSGSMPATIGLPSFTIEHLMFGVALGLWPVVRAQDFLAAHAAVAHAH